MISQTRHAAQRHRQTGPEDTSNVRDGVAESGRSAEPRMGTLYDPSARFVGMTIVCV